MEQSLMRPTETCTRRRGLLYRAERCFIKGKVLLFKQWIEICIISVLGSGMFYKLDGLAKLQFSAAL